MNKTQLHKFIQSIVPKMLEAGELAIQFQGKVPNLKKEVNAGENTPQLIKDRNEAKTEIDEKVQEILLLNIYDTIGAKGIHIDAEEDTPSKKLFQDQDASLTIVIDPIDGTLEYLNGNSTYSINVGVIKDGEVLTTIIYFPKWKKLYYLDENKTSYEVSYDKELHLKEKKELTRPATVEPNSVYTNNRVPETVITHLEKQGITVIQDDGKVLWPEAILKCLSGEFTASIFHNPQTRDVLLGAIVQNIPGGFMANWKGEKIAWPNGGRIPRVIFGVGELPSKILACLSEKINLKTKLQKLKADLKMYEERLRIKMKTYRGVIHESASSELKHSEVMVLTAMVDGLKSEIHKLENDQN